MATFLTPLMPASGVQLEMETIRKAASDKTGWEPPCSSGWNTRWNFDGFLSYAGPREPGAGSYVQVFRANLDAAEALLDIQTPPPLVIPEPWPAGD